MKKSKSILVLTAALLLSGFAVIAPAQTGIKSIDFKNFTYEPSCTDMEGGSRLEKITVKNGEHTPPPPEGDEAPEGIYFQIGEISYGDLNGDGEDEAVILTGCNTGGSGVFSEAFIYTMRGGKPFLLTRLEGGDRAFGGLRSVQVENGLLVVEINDAGEDGAACCPEFVVTSKYRLSGGKLTAVGKSERRELYPATRVIFEKGAFSKEMTAVIPAGEFKRFKVTARRGQLLKVTSKMPDVSFNLYKGEAEQTEDLEMLKAKLLKNGDYIFDVVNAGETEREVVFRVEITSR